MAATVLAPRLLTATGANESVELTWEAVLGVSGYRVRYGIDSTDENRIDTGAPAMLETSIQTWTCRLSLSDESAQSRCIFGRMISRERSLPYRV
jgi:hypothetical protein